MSLLIVHFIMLAALKNASSCARIDAIQESACWKFSPRWQFPFLSFHHHSSQYPVNPRLVSRPFGLEPVHHFAIHAQ